ncbi:ankyrin repeat domain-containing protein [Plastoroseomonas hellenica]|uniref:ankyrin repeat domain-containing protein n=1 Tax=Plastoroseomonas hellenica TaxID=2687306 RepID=UPI001BA80017|nr:ankyrin repeat domain-containing protein [Plastoroseomonas hellenica]MBR0641443.1 ankyrin repeat domain-containing protein [Plastoroseomonas hellenica]
MDVAKAAALLAAARDGDEARVRELLSPAGGSESDGPHEAPDGLTPLMAAAAGGYEAIVEVLLGHGADPARPDHRGRSAAAHARQAGHTTLAERLDTIVDKETTIW